MTWRIIVVNEHSKLSYQNGSLLYKSDQAVEKIHLSEIHTLVLETTDINITTGLIYKLLANVSIRLCVWCMLLMVLLRYPHFLIPIENFLKKYTKVNNFMSKVYHTKFKISCLFIVV